MIEARRVQHNVEHTIKVLQSSLAVLELANRANHQLEAKKYYSALKVMSAVSVALMT